MEGSIKHNSRAPAAAPEPNRNRASDNPGGMECQNCGVIFVGDESHSLCGVCVRKPEVQQRFYKTVAAPSQPVAPVVADGFDFRAHLQRQREWSERTFGPGARTAGVCDHIRKELIEVEADPTDPQEWVDVIILALDGAWRCGWSPEQIIAGIVAKQTKNEGRRWPDWRTAPQDKAIEHER
jgi:hypothetical protein